MSQSVQETKGIILHNKLHKKTTKLTGRTSCHFFLNIELKFIIDDLIS